MKRSTKRVGIKLLKILCILVASPFVYQGINLFLPHIDAMASRLAIISAGTVMPEGGNAVLSDKISQYQQGEENSDISTIIESPQVPQETQTSSESQESSQPVLASRRTPGKFTASNILRRRIANISILEIMRISETLPTIPTRRSLTRLPTLRRLKLPTPQSRRC